MSEAAPCPYCGRTRTENGRAGEGRQAGVQVHPVDSLYREVRRIREIAEARESAADKDRRIEELALEVRRLQETVARLRGISAGVAARPSHREASLSYLS